MGIGYEDAKPHLDKLNAVSLKERMEKSALKRAQQQALTELSVDDRWHLYRQQLEAEQAKAQQTHEQIGSVILMGLKYEDYVKQMALMMYAKGRAEALREAIEIVIKKPEPLDKS